MAFTPPLGSVAAWIQSDNASVITVSQGSVATVIVGGSIAASFTPPANQSVSGTVQADIRGSVATVIIGGSIAASFTPPANQSVSGAVSVSNFPTTQNVSGSVVAFVNQNSSIAAVIIGGSIAASFTPPANQSVSGAVSVSNFPTTQNVSGSVVATQGTNPWTVTSSIVGGIFPVSGSVAAVVTNNVTVVSSIAGGIFPISGSVAATITNTNINVSGSVVAFQAAGWSGSVAATVTNANLNVSGSVAAWLQSTNASVITVGTAAPNQSVSGTVQTDVRGSVATVIIGGSIAASFTPPANQSVSGTVNDLLLSSNASVITVAQSSVAVAIVSGSIAATFTPPANQSVSGTVGASVIGLTPVAVTNTPSISGTVNVGNTVPVTLSGNPSISGTVLVNNGSVVAFQGTSPWVVNYQNSSIITVSSGSIAAVIIGGSVATATTNSSVMLLNGANTIGSVTTLQGTNPWIVTSSIAGGIFPISGSVAAVITNTPNVNTAGSVVAFQGAAPWTQTFSNSSIIAIVTGSVLAIQSGTQISSVVSSTPSSMLTGASIFGQLPAGTAVLGSVAALQGTNPWIVVNPAGSVQTTISTAPAGSVMAVSGISFAGSVLAGNTSSVIQQGTWQVSVAGTYATNAASVISGLGVLMQGVRNDGMGSVFATTDGFYGPFATGQWGDQIVSMAPASVWTSGNGSVYTGTPQPIIGSVSGRFLNITGVQVANASANNVYLTFYGTGLGSVAGSIIAYTVVPASGGSNINYPIPLRTQVSQPFQASVSGVASVLISAQGFYSKV